MNRSAILHNYQNKVTRFSRWSAGCGDFARAEYWDRQATRASLHLAGKRCIVTSGGVSLYAKILSFQTI